MKFPIIAAILFVVALPAERAEAQRQDQFVWGIGGGATIPSGWAADNHTTGGHGLLMLGIGAVDSPFGIRIEGMYSSLGDNEGDSLAVDQGSARVFTLTGNAMFSIYGSNRRLYAVAGAGGFWYNPERSGSSTLNDFMVGAGLGLWFPGLHGFVETRWVNLYRALPDPVTGLRGKKSARLFPVTLGIMF